MTGSDVEGAELEVLTGMRGMLTAEQPIVLCEVLPDAGGRTADETEARRSRLHKLVAELGYGIHHVKRSGDVDVRIEPVSIFLGGPFTRKKSWDYLLLPR